MKNWSKWSDFMIKNEQISGLRKMNLIRENKLSFPIDCFNMVILSCLLLFICNPIFTKRGVFLMCSNFWKSESV